VLVVEDDHGVRDVVARGLREEGFRVTTVVDGRSALRTIEGLVIYLAVSHKDESAPAAVNGRRVTGGRHTRV
jgi:CheY-like chemotaxis protein